MARFALIVDGVFKEIRNYPEQPEDIPHKKVIWLPYVEETKDDSTGPDTISSVRRNAIKVSRVVTTTTIRDMMLEEIKARDDAKKDDAIAHMQLDFDLTKAVALVLLDFINGDIVGPLTQKEFKTLVRGKL